MGEQPFDTYRRCERRKLTNLHSVFDRERQRLVSLDVLDDALCLELIVFEVFPPDSMFKSTILYPPEGLTPVRSCHTIDLSTDEQGENHGDS